jgi:four helix bundle protein
MQFEDLKMWKESQNLYNELCFFFYQDNFKDYFFRDQILRACLSISNNIAEWFERETNNEFSRFLYLAKWSSWEVRSMLYLAYTRNYINQSEFDKLLDKSKHITIMIYNYIKKL